MNRDRNRYRRLAKVLAGGLAGVSLFAGGLALAAGTSSIALGESGPQPATITVKWGDTVAFRNAGPKDHAVTIPRVSAESPVLEPGQTWTRVFDGRAGRYPYRQVVGRGYPGLVLVELDGTVTMKASAEIVTFGKRVSFSGTSLPNYPVKLEQLVSPQSGAWAEQVSVVAAADGTWSTSLVAERGGRFRATAAAGQLKSPTFSLGVQPAVSLVAPRGAKAKKMVSVQARIVPPGAVTTADLERYDRARRRWVREDRRRIPASGRVAFRWEAVKGRSQLRVTVLRFGVKQGFAAVTSRPVLVNVR
jgi:plastocyanin